MYNVTLVNLAADARSVAAFAHTEQRDLGNDQLRERLQCFCAIDPIENASAETEIRVKVRRENYLLRTEQGQLIFYDMSRRDLPAQLLTIDQVMSELDGTAAAARDQAIMLARAVATPAPTGPVVPVVPPAAASKPRVFAMALTAGLLLAAIIYVAGPVAGRNIPVGFVPVETAELDGLQAALTGVYMTGSEPGQHGIVVAGPGELKLFELAAVEAPRIVYATYAAGRLGAEFCLATDQPGGLIEVPGDGTLVYCGEIYRRIP